MEIECPATTQHRIRERGSFFPIESAEKHRHQKCRHLIVGNMPRDVRAQKRAPLAWIDSSAISLTFDQSDREH